MSEDLVITKDFFGESVVFPRDFLLPLDSSTQNHLIKLVEKPALLIVQIKDGLKWRHYFRAIDWHETLLLRTIWNHSAWVARGVEKNPPGRWLGEALQNGNQLL